MRGNRRLLASLGLALFLYGTVFAVLVFTEVQILAPSFPGYPFGSYRVTADTCLVKAPGFSENYPVCSFLNYDQVLYLGVFFGFVGLIMWRYYRDLSGSVQGRTRE